MVVQGRTLGRAAAVLLVLAALSSPHAAHAYSPTAVGAVVTILGALSLVTQQSQLALVGLLVPKGAVREFEVETAIAEAFVQVGCSLPALRCPPHAPAPRRLLVHWA